MEGVFKRKKGKAIFENTHGMVTEVREGEVSLTVLKKILANAHNHN